MERTLGIYEDGNHRTNILPASSLVDLARNKGYEVAIVSVTEREVGQFDTRLDVQDLGQILENGLWGESIWGKFLWGNTTYLESILKIISNGSFPKPGQRAQQLTEGQRRQLRDAMILNAHAREGRGIFVTDDKKGFVEREKRKVTVASENSYPHSRRVPSGTANLETNKGAL